MTTLNEKAMEYLSEKCGLTPKDNYYTNIQNAYIAGATEATRWRDVNVELPELNQEFLGKMNVPEQWNDSVEFTTEHRLYKRISPIDADCREKLLKDGCIAWRPIETI